jgi:hypothetical protein
LYGDVPFGRLRDHRRADDGPSVLSTELAQQRFGSALRIAVRGVEAVDPRVQKGLIGLEKVVAADHFEPMMTVPKAVRLTIYGGTAEDFIRPPARDRR